MARSVLSEAQWRLLRDAASAEVRRDPAHERDLRVLARAGLLRELGDGRFCLTPTGRTFLLASRPSS